MSWSVCFHFVTVLNGHSTQQTMLNTFLISDQYSSVWTAYGVACYCCDRERAELLKTDISMKLLF